MPSGSGVASSSSLEEKTEDVWGAATDALHRVTKFELVTRWGASLSRISDALRRVANGSSDALRRVTTRGFMSGGGGARRTAMVNETTRGSTRHGTTREEEISALIA